MLLLILPILLQIHFTSPCTPSGSGISPSTAIQTSAGSGNTSFATETLYNSVKTVAHLHFGGTAGALITLSIVFCLFIIAYQKLSTFVHLINDRLHSLAELFGVHGFSLHQPAIVKHESPPVTATEAV